MSRIEKAVSTFQKDYSCSQSVFSAFAEDFGIDYETALKVAGGFGGGMGRMGEVCGAVSGAVMVIGLKNSEGKAETVESKARTYEIVRDFIARFKSRNENVRCNDLLGVDISTQEGHEEALSQGLFKTRCKQYVRDAAEILEEML
ncbi:C-GCAxxG-C-C family protein [Candidatus Omnitrophota bacterium]